MKGNKGLRVFEGATVIITGGASGIGKAFAEELAKRGAEVVLADLQVEQAGIIADAIRATGGKATAVKLDVTDSPAVEQVVHETFLRTGRLDYIFNNAGIMLSGGVHEFKTDDWNYIVNVNIRGVIAGIQAACPIMFMQGFGHIVNTSSISGLIPSPGEVAYAMTKHAVVGLSKSLRGQAGLFGVHVSVLCPGFIRTPMMENGGKYGRNYTRIDPAISSQIAERFKPMSPDLFACKSLEAIAKNKAMIIEPPWWRWVWRFYRLFPEYSINLSQKAFKMILIKTGMWPKTRK